MLSAFERVDLIAVRPGQDQRIDLTTAYGAQDLFGFIQPSLEFRDRVFRATLIL
jgi:hypothetical protein